MTELLRNELETLQQIVTIRENSELLMDTLVNLLTKTIQYCHKNKIPIENELPIEIMINQTRNLLQNLTGLPTKYQQPNKTPSGIDRIILL